MATKSEKLLIGPRITRFRKTLGLTQARMAEDLGISTSYLNLMERNQRALSAKVLLKMAEIYDFDIAGFTGAILLPKFTTRCVIRSLKKRLCPKMKQRI